jgi:hypothetical protein
VVRRSSCRSIMLRQEELAFVKAISTLQMSPAVLRELRTALSRWKRKPVVPAGSRSTAPVGGAGAPQRPTGQRTGKHIANELATWASHPSPQTVAQRLSTGPRLCPRAHRQSRANKLLRKSATRSPPVRGDVRSCLRRDHCLVSAKWDAQAHSHRFGPVRICCLTRNSRQTHV